MIIKEVYNQLTQKNLTLADFQDILDLKKQCKIEMNQEYLYLCDILIIDIYINEGLYDDALNIAFKNIDNIDNIVFQKIYVSLIERIIYIFIQKKNYKSAYRYAFMKRNFIDIDNVDEVNRWYLEMAYIYAELNQKDKALLNLKAILNNYPNDSLKALTLSNITKLYIDQEQIHEAKKTLSDCITLVYKLDDEEGILYCNYLNAKLYILEKNYKHAKQSFQDIFKNIHVMNDDYLSIANEYIALLIEMDLYDEAFRVSIKYLKDIEKSDNLRVKKNYYKNYLKIHVLRNKNIRDDVRQLLKAIEVLEAEIDKYDENILNESNEDDKKIEIDTKLKAAISKIEKTINVINLALKNENERDCFMEFSKQLEEIIPFDEALYVVFAKSDFEILPEFFDNYNKVNTYNYKKQRLYERELSFNNLSGTIVEMLIAANHEVMIDFNDSSIDVKDLITEESYIKSDVKSLIAIPLTYENEMFGCAIYTSYESLLIEMDTMVNLKIATKLLEFRLITLFYQESIRAKKNIIQVAINGLEEGLFYLDPNKQTMFLSEQLAVFLGFETRNINKENLTERLIDEDQKIRNNIDKFIENGEPYKFEYRIVVHEKEILVREQGDPYISRDGLVKYYVGTFHKLANPVELTHKKLTLLGFEDYLRKFTEIENKSHDLEYKCAFAKFRIDNLNEYQPKIKDKITEYIYQTISEKLSSETYLVNDFEIISLTEISDQKSIDGIIKSILSVFDQGIIYDDLLINFDVRVSLVRFPRDTYNINEVIEFCDISLETNNRYQIFNDDIRKKYLKKKSITSCVAEHLKRESIEILYLPLETNDFSSAYEVKYNINGILPKENIYEYLDQNYVFAFEKLVFKSLMNDIKSIEQSRFYLHMSCLTLDYLMKDGFFKKDNLDIYKHIILCIDDYAPNINKIINYLYSFGVRVNINYRVLTKLNLDTLIKNVNINGIFIEEAVEERSKLLNICNCLDLELLTNYQFPDYNKIVFKTDKLVNLSTILKS